MEESYYREQFTKFDLNSDGFLDKGEMKKMLELYFTKEGLVLTEEALLYQINNFDASRDGLVSF